MKPRLFKLTGVREWACALPGTYRRDEHGRLVYVAPGAPFGTGTAAVDAFRSFKHDLRVMRFFR